MTKKGLDRDSVVEEAARLADEIGLDHLTMAALARRLDIAMPSLYAHVRSLEHLRQQIAALACEELAQLIGEATQGRVSFEAVATIASAYRQYARQFPGRYDASTMPPDLSDPRHAAAIEQIARPIYAALRSYGLEEPEATHAVRTLRSTLHGFVSLERAGGFALPRSLDTSFQRSVEALDRALRTWPASDPETR